MLTTFALALTPALPPTNQSDKPIARVEQYLESCEAFGWSGVALIEHDGRIVLNRGFGEADREEHRDNTPSTVFEIASATKPFTAAAILALVEDGVLDLDSSIALYLPGVPEDKHGITVRHLLSHTSGMPRSAGGGGGDDLAAAVQSNLSAKAVTKPGMSHAYWNGGYALLAGIIDHNTEEGYVAYLHERLFSRARLKATGFTGEEIWGSEDQAIGYANGARVRPASGHPYGSSYGYQYRGMGGIVTSAEELLQLGRAVLGGKVLKQRTVEEMLTVVDGSYGLGWAVTQTKRGTTRISHGGDVRGFHTQMHFLPDDDTAIVLLSNVDEVPMWHLAWNIEALLLGGAVPYPRPPEIRSGSELALHAGTYALESGERIVVAAQDNTLNVTAQGIGAALLLSGVDHDESTRALIEASRKVVEAIAAGESEPVAAVLSNQIPASWPARLAKQIFPAHVAQWGPVEAIVPTAIAGVGSGTESCVLTLDHGDTKTHVRVVFTGGKLTIFDLKAAPPQQIWRFAPVATNEKERDAPVTFRTFKWSAMPASAPDARALRFEFKRRKSVALELTIAGGTKVRAVRTK